MNINNIRAGDYYIPDLALPEKIRLIDKWRRMRREYLREYQLICINSLLLPGKLQSYLADLYQQI